MRRSTISTAYKKAGGGRGGIQSEFTHHSTSCASEQERTNELLGADLVVLPTSSTFIISGRDDKNEKLKKKAKIFLDERQKIKSRAQSLWSYIDATNSFDQSRFFQEHAEQVFNVVYETCMQQIVKIKHKSERPQSWNSKELVNLQKTLVLLRKIFLYVPELMRNGWQRQNIAKILTHILDNGNHPRLRSLGFQLLLLWLNDQTVEYKECMDLFANAIPLNAFLLDKIEDIPLGAATVNEVNQEEKDNQIKLHASGLHFVKKLRENHTNNNSNHNTNNHINSNNNHSNNKTNASSLESSQLGQTLIRGDDQPPLFPNPTQPTFNDSIGLIHVFISNLIRLAYVASGSPPPPDEYDYPTGDHFEVDDGIATGVGIDAATASAKFLFKIFRTYYMTKFVPLITKSLDVQDNLKNKVIGFSSCPPSILRSLLRFLIGYCIDNNYHSRTHWPQASTSWTSSLSSPATPILKSIVLSSHENREILHELLRQSLVLPCTNPNYRDITRGAIHILGVWILGSEDERPSFLRRSSSSLSSSSSTNVVISINDKPVEIQQQQQQSYFDETPLSVSSTSSSTGCYTEANKFLRRYLLMIKLIFENNKSTNNNHNDVTSVVAAQNVSAVVIDWEGLVSLYKDAINLYRTITVSKGGIDIEWESWELLLQCLLDIQHWLMGQSDTKIPVQSLANDLADYLWETLFHAFVRAKIIHLELWQQLKDHIISSMSWAQTLNQWVRVMHKLTSLLSSRLYQVEYDSSLDKSHVVEEPPTEFGGHSRRSSNSNIIGAVFGRVRTRSRHLSMQGSSPNSKRNNSGRPLSTTGASDSQLVDIKHMMHKATSPTSEHYPSSLNENNNSHHLPTPEGSMSSILRNINNTTLSEFASSFNRKSTILTSVPDDEQEQDESKEINVSYGSSYSGNNTNHNTFPSSSGKRSSFNGAMISSNGSGSLNGGHSTNLNGGGMGRRTISIQQLDTLWQDSGSKLMNFVHHGPDTPQPTSGGFKNNNNSLKEEDRRLLAEWDRRSEASSNEKLEEGSLKSNRTSSSFAWPAIESISMTNHPNSATERLPSNLGSFKSSNFLTLGTTTFDGLYILSIWKNMFLAIGNINKIEGPQNHSTAMQCLVDIWDIFHYIRYQQPYSNVPIPSMYEFAPWLFQAVDLPDEYNSGKSKACGSLCRLVSRQPEEAISEGYYAAFYKVILNSLASNDTNIVRSIMTNSECLFSFSLPGIHILIPPFINAIEKQLLSSRSSYDIPFNVRKSCITILGSLISTSNHYTNIVIEIENIELLQCIRNGYNNNSQGEKNFALKDVKVWLKDIFIQLATVGAFLPQTEEDVEIHCMILSALCTLVLDEVLTSESPEENLTHECILLLVNHFYWCSIPIVNTVADCLNTFSQIYDRKYDTDGIIIQEIFMRIIDSIHVHLKNYEKNTRGGRGFIISKLFSCLLEWTMVIDPAMLTETDLFDVVFEVIEAALQTNVDVTEKLLRRTSSHRKNKNKNSFKFRMPSEKRPLIYHDLVNNMLGSDMIENDQDYVKESAEAILLHLLHHFNNFAPPYGPAMIHSTIIGPGISQDGIDYSQYQYFSFNDTTIIAFVELPRTNDKGAQSRMIIRDLTGRYVWDSQMEPKYIDESESRHEEAEAEEEEEEETIYSPSSSSLDSEKQQQQKYILNQDVCVRSSNEIIEDIVSNATISTDDPMANLLERIENSHPDCMLDPNVSSSPDVETSTSHNKLLNNLSEKLNVYLKNEAQNNKELESDVRLWYSKMNILRKKENEGQIKRGESVKDELLEQFSLKKDFLPAFPHEAESPSIPFQQSRLLMSHMGFIHYEQLKDGNFQVLNKTPALYRDLRGLDRKHGREIMKIGLIYVGPGQEDEQSILQNSKGSEKYNAFVNSLGWDINIATHTGYLGGLERNLTNGTRATYYCSSTIEMIFHDVTKMPTDISDPKQLKKKRHIGNDHVHIVWNEHDRDYKMNTIGGDFGNAQIIVTPLPSNQFSIQIYRDSKIPYFGPLLDRMIVSQAALGPLVRSTAIDAFRASVHTNLYSFYKCVYAQRSTDVKTIINRHKTTNWTYMQFIENVFLLEEQA